MLVVRDERIEGMIGSDRWGGGPITEALTIKGHVLPLLQMVSCGHCHKTKADDVVSASNPRTIMGGLLRCATV